MFQSIFNQRTMIAAIGEKVSQYWESCNLGEKVFTSLNAVSRYLEVAPRSFALQQFAMASSAASNVSHYWAGLEMGQRLAASLAAISHYLLTFALMQRTIVAAIISMSSQCWVAINLGGMITTPLNFTIRCLSAYSSALTDNLVAGICLVASHDGPLSFLVVLLALLRIHAVVVLIKITYRHGVEAFIIIGPKGLHEPPKGSKVFFYFLASTLIPMWIMATGYAMIFIAIIDEIYLIMAISSHLSLAAKIFVQVLRVTSDRGFVSEMKCLFRRQEYRQLPAGGDTRSKGFTVDGHLARMRELVEEKRALVEEKEMAIREMDIYIVENEELKRELEEQRALYEALGREDRLTIAVLRKELRRRRGEWSDEATDDEDF